MRSPLPTDSTRVAWLLPNCWAGVLARFICWVVFHNRTRFRRELWRNAAMPEVLPQRPFAGSLSTAMSVAPTGKRQRWRCIAPSVGKMPGLIRLSDRGSQFWSRREPVTKGRSLSCIKRGAVDYGRDLCGVTRPTQHPGANPSSKDHSMRTGVVKWVLRLGNLPALWLTALESDRAQRYVGGAVNWE